MLTTDFKYLRKPVEFIPENDILNRFQELLESKNIMTDYISNNSNAAGLAANQLQINLPIICFKVGNNIENIINPTITSHSIKTENCNESCLSIPDTVVSVQRFKSITVTGWRISFDGSLKKVTRNFEDFLSSVVQHEVDHLNGILIIDRGEIIKDSKVIQK